MRDVVGILVVVFLVVVALRMTTSLQWHKRRHAATRRAIEQRGQSVIAEIPASEGVRFFSEDRSSFYWNDRVIPKDGIRAARVLISGTPLSVRVSNRFEAPAPTASTTIPTPADGFERDRWDVEIDLEDGTIVVECGAIRERVSQELARHVFEAVSRGMDSQDRSPGSTTPARVLHGDG